MSERGTWRVERHRDDAATFHMRPLPEPLHREVWVGESTRPALVLGSAQRDDVVDRDACARAGVEVVRRRSGGGAVLVEPGSLLWVDVLLPADDPLWEHDVGLAFLWLGEAWAGALADSGAVATVHRGPLVRTRWSDIVCFGGLGSGELTDPTGRKVLGISQRRTRAGARFQCAVLRTWEPAALVALLALTAQEREMATAELAGAAAGLGDRLDRVLPALLDRLP